MRAMSQITTHVLDTSRGLPAADLPVSLHQLIDGSWHCLAKGKTSAQGRVENLLVPDKILPAGCYRLKFETGVYFNEQGTSSFFPHVDVTFNIDVTGQHYHIPLLLSAYGYTTYRGS